MGYWIGKPFWGKGYITEALKAVLAFGFDKLQLNRIEAHHLDFNEASGAVLMKVGMRHEGILRKHVKKNGEFYDIVLFGLISQDYKDQLSKDF